MQIATIQQLPAPAQDAAGNLFQSGFNMVSNVVQTFVGQIASFISKIGDFFKGILGALTSAWDAVSGGTCYIIQYFISPLSTPRSSACIKLCAPQTRDKQLVESLEAKLTLQQLAAQLSVPFLASLALLWSPIHQEVQDLRPLPLPLPMPMTMAMSTAIAMEMALPPSLLHRIMQ